MAMRAKTKQPADVHAGRRDRLRHALRKLEADGVLVTNFTNVTYLTGFTGDDSFLLVWSAGELLISDGRYALQLEEECPGVERHLRLPGAPMAEATAQAVRRIGVKRLAIEASSMTVELREALGQALPGLQLCNTSGLVESLRRVKDRGEIEQICQAIHVAQRGYAALRAVLRPEMREKEAADELEYWMRRFGARGASFPTIVAGGARAALPHARAGQQRLDAAPVVLVDWGANGGLYQSDLTRILVTDRISPELKKVYGVVLKAQLRAIAAVRPGIEAAKVDRVARRVIEEAGYGPYFAHGLGHGLGLEVHEEPRLNPSSRAILEAGMVITIEPGIYLPGRFGVRIEDDVLVTKDGHAVLSGLPKEFDQVVATLQ